MYMYLWVCCVALPVCLTGTLLASFFFPSHLSFKNMYPACAERSLALAYLCIYSQGSQSGSMEVWHWLLCEGY